MSLKRLSNRKKLVAQLLEQEGIKLSQANKILPRKDRNNLPLSFAQQRLWFLDQLGDGSVTYNICFAVRLKGDLNISALEQSLSEMIRRHEVLRTVFPTVEGEGVQVIEPPRPISFEMVELSQCRGPGGELEMQFLVDQEAMRPFDLARGPLVRAKLLRLSGREHVALLALHHIVSDGWARGVLVKEVAALYEAFSKGQPSPLPDLPIQYADFALWQREWFQGEVLEEQVEYWKNQLAGAPRLLQLPTDTPRPAVQTFNGSIEKLNLPDELVAELSELSRREGTTMFMTLLAAFNILLSKYTGQDDIVVGSPIANRTRIETQALMGFFINTLVLRTRVRDEVSFRDCLKDVRETSLGAYAHQDLPFEKLVDEMETERTLSYTPLFQVVFVLQHASAEVLDLPGLTIELLNTHPGTSKFDLTLQLVETGDKIGASVEYNTDLFEADTIKRMLQHYCRVLESVVNNPDKPIRSIDLITPEERHEQEVEWNDTAREYEGLLIHEFIERQGRERGEETAVIYGEERMSYGELNRRANQLARYLRKLGAGPEKLIGVYLERGLEMIVGLLGILKSGGAYVPLEPTYPEKRVRYMVEEAGIEVVVTVDKYRERGWGEEVRVVRLDGEKEMIGKESEEEERVEVRGKNLAYVMYTSGSTGKPKAAMNTHEGISNRLQWMQEEYGLEGTDVVMQKTPYSFDVSVWELFWPLMYGARLVIAKPEGHKDSGYLVELIKKEEVTTIHFVPAMLRTFLEEEGVKECASLRRVISSGEALGVEEVEKVRERMGVELYNLYGPTEAAVDVTWWKCGEEGGSSVPIGRPISNMEVRILDGRGEMVAVGVTGELYISGVGVGRGYLKGEEQTAERYVPDGYGGKEGGRQYRTGDLARWRRDGSVEYVGRKDEQVKVRGYRIELGEIEAVLSQHEGVREAVVVVKEEERSKRLVGYVVERGEGAREEELREYLKDRLPEYMVPWVIEKVEEMPVTANGKVDRKRLEQREVERGGKEEGYRGPRTGAEEVLAAVWEQVLKVERVGIDENFFELGGDSIRSIQVVAMAKERGVEVSLQELFQHQTIAELAGEIRRGGGEGGERRGEERIRTEAKSLIREEDRAGIGEEIEDAYPLTKLQAGMMYHMELTPETPVYHNVDSMRLKMKWEGEEFEEAVEEVVKRHAVMRTSFEMSKYSEPLQMVHREAKVEIGVSDIREKSEEEQEEEIEEFIKREGKRRFDYRKAPLIRFYIHKRSEEEIQFTITESHTINDGWSLHSTLAEIFEYYFALIKGEEPAKGEELKVSFRDYVAMERAAVESEECQQYWAEKLADCTFMQLPRRGFDDAEEAGERMEYIEIPAAISLGLKNMATVAAVPIKSVLLAAHLKVMSIISGQSDVVTGLVSNGRPEETDGERVRGLFLNTLPFRQKLKAETWEQLVRDTFKSEWELLPYRRYPMAEIQERIGRGALYETAFNFIHFHVVEGLLKTGSVEVKGFKSAESTNLALFANFDLDLANNQVRLRLAFDAARLNEIEAKEIAGYYSKVLETMATEPKASHEAHSFLSKEQERQLLVDFNDTYKPFPLLFISHFIERQSQLTPDATAVVFDQQRLTYGELNGRANQLAHYLCSQEAGPETVIGICMDRSIEMIVGLLGILKCGAAYIPLDPTYPEQRLRFMVEDSGVGLVLTLDRHSQAAFGEQTKLLRVDGEWEMIARQSAQDPEVDLRGDNLAYIIYTSGSTGKPKAAMNTHIGISNRLQWMQQQYKLDQSDAVMQKTPSSFDVSVWELFWPLMYGARLVMAKPEGHKDSAYLLELIKQESVTTIHFVPAMLRVFLGEDGVEECKSLKRVICSGEALGVEEVEKMHERLDVEIHNLYGPTEAAVDVTWWKCLRGATQEGVPIGMPISNTELRILDRWGQMVGVGVTGELFIGGVGVGRGYMNRADQTAEKYLPDSYSRQEGGRHYRTGDLARWRRDGCIEYAGRVDEQVKVRGYRIELGEIEAVLSQYASVREAVVLAREEAGSKRLIAYVVSNGNDTSSNTEMKKYLREKLPEYMVPSAFVALEALPLTANGKVDRRALMNMEPESQEPEVSYMAPRDQLEETIASVWKEVLRAERVGIHNNFFDLGGHSLTLIEANSKLRKAAGIEVTLIEMFRHPTIASLVEFINRGDRAMAGESQGRAEGRREKTKLQRERRNRRLPRKG